MLLIGLSGRARSGKGTVAKAMQQAAWDKDLTCEIYEISQYILESCQEKGLIDGGKTREELNHEERQMLVEEGRLGRILDGNYWLYAIEEDIKLDEPDVAIIPNIRFASEADWVAGSRGFVINVKRLNTDGSQYISPDRDPNDVSETTADTLPAFAYIVAAAGRPCLLKEIAKAHFDWILQQRQQYETNARAFGL